MEEGYVSLFRVNGRPLLPPCMTEERRVECRRWRELALERSERRSAAKVSSRGLSDSQETVVVNPEYAPTEVESPVLSAYAQRFGAGGLDNYLNRLSTPPKTSPKRRQLGAGASKTRMALEELEKEKEVVIQKFLEERARQLVNIKKSYQEQKQMILRRAAAETYSPPESREVRLAPRTLDSFAKLSAFVKGYLVRRLMATQKVQGILNSLKDSLKMALQLHQEAVRTRKSSESDITLHKTLLQQIHKDVNQFHDIFFGTSAEAKMAVISSDRESLKKHKPQKKLLSAVTKQRMKQKLEGKDSNKENRVSLSPKKIPEPKTMPTLIPKGKQPSRNVKKAPVRLSLTKKF